MQYVGSLLFISLLSLLLLRSFFFVQLHLFCLQLRRTRIIPQCGHQKYALLTWFAVYFE